MAAHFEDGQGFISVSQHQFTGFIDQFFAPLQRRQFMRVHLRGQSFDPLHQNLVTQLTQGLWVVLAVRQGAGLVQNGNLQVAQNFRLDA